MFAIIIAAALAASPQAYEDLEALDEMVSLIDVNALPIDMRLKLAVCPDEPIITPAFNGAIVVRCEAKGWRLRVPVKPPNQVSAATPPLLVRRGEMVECVDMGQGFAVSISMVALEDGALGQAIRVKSLTSSTAVTVIVTARGTVIF